MPTTTELRHQRGVARREAMDALANNNKPVYERAMSDVDRLGIEIEKLEMRYSTSAQRTPEDMVASLALLSYLRGKHLNEAETRALNTLAEQRDVNEGGNQTGHIGSYAGLSYFIPTGFANQIEDAQKYYAPLLDSDVFTTLTTKTGNAIPYPVSNDTNKHAVLASEASAVTTSSVVEPTASHVLFGAHKMTSGLIKASIELLQDSGIDLEAWFAQRFGERWGRGLEEILTNGVGGSASPTGLLVAIAASGATPIIAEGSSESTGGSQTGANSIGYGDLVDLEHSVDPSYRRRGRFMFNDSVLQSLKRILDKYGRPLWQPGMVAGAPDTINGYRYVINQAFPTIGASNVTVAFGDFSKFIVRKVAGLSIIRLNELYAANGQVGFISFARIDSNLIDAGTHPLNVLQQSS